MSLQLNSEKYRTIVVSGFAAEADPRVTPPTAALLYVPEDKLNQQGFENKQISGLAIIPRFLDVANAEVVGPTATFTPWIKDEATGLYVKASASVATIGSGGHACVCPFVGTLYVQVTAIASAGAATQLVLRVARRAAQGTGSGASVA